MENGAMSGRKSQHDSMAAVTESWNYSGDWQSAGSLLQKLGLRLDKLSFTHFFFL